MKPFLHEETKRLTKSWMQHNEIMLRDYLVSQVEDPRLNLQSILTRHFLVENLFGTRFHELQAAEICFAVALNWLMKFLKEYPVPEDAQALLHALSRGADDANGIEIPDYMGGLFSNFPMSVDGTIIPNFIEEPLALASREGGKKGFPEELKTLFQGYWRKRLGRRKPRNLSVLEPACGSANDYRFIDAYGLGRLIHYTGFDLCEKNVGNARKMFPQVAFQLGNVFAIDAPDKAFDLCIVHDLFEHLSIKAMETAIAEVCRVTKRALCVGFFNMAEEKDHLVQPVDDYHWNRLSMERTRKAFLQHSQQVQVLHIGTYLRSAIPDAETHNENAYTFVVVTRS